MKDVCICIESNTPLYSTHNYTIQFTTLHTTQFEYNPSGYSGYSGLVDIIASIFGNDGRF